jgi:hypothetical protein
MTSAFERLQETSNAIRSQSGVDAIRCARCSQGTAIRAAGPDAKTTRDAPRSRRPPPFRFTRDVSGAAPNNLIRRIGDGVEKVLATVRGNSVHCSREVGVGRQSSA